MSAFWVLLGHWVVQQDTEQHPLLNIADSVYTSCIIFFTFFFWGTGTPGNIVL
jgi:cellobiose-specific phosphotransferase system component IIC